MASQQVLPLTDIDPTKKRVTICVRVSRMWDYYTKEHKLGHVDLVLIDQMGNKIYAEIGSIQASKLKEIIKEGSVYYIRDFLVQSAKIMYKAVEGKFMIKLTNWSKIEQHKNIPPDFPRYAYSLTSFDQLPKLIGRKESFLDTIGIITAISDLLHVQLPGVTSVSLKRNLQLMDIDGKNMDVALWGDHATNFDGEKLFKEGQSQVLVILLVGTLMKDYRGHDTISCGEAAKFYINPDIPEVTEYNDRLGLHLPEVQWMNAEDDQYQKAYKQADPEEIDIKTLPSRDPYDLLGMNMVCTVTIMKLQTNSWWFLACKKCHKTSYPAGNEFVCSDPNCQCVAAGPRYKICLIGNDNTGEAQFVFFAGVAEQIVGKTVDVLQRTSERKQETMPAEIAALVS